MHEFCSVIQTVKSMSLVCTIYPLKFSYEIQCFMILFNSFCDSIAILRVSFSHMAKFHVMHIDISDGFPPTVLI